MFHIFAVFLHSFCHKAINLQSMAEIIDIASHDRDQYGGDSSSDMTKLYLKLMEETAKTCLTMKTYEQAEPLLFNVMKMAVKSGCATKELSDIVDKVRRSFSEKEKSQPSISIQTDVINLKDSELIDMGRKIRMIGENAEYVETRSAALPDDDREVTLEGKNAKYTEVPSNTVLHMPRHGNVETGLRQYEFLVNTGYIASTTHELHFLYLMGYSSNMPEDIKPIEWLTTKEQLHRMLQKRYAVPLANNVLTEKNIKDFVPKCFVDKKGECIEIPKPREENSQMMDILIKNFPTL